MHPTIAAHAALEAYSVLTRLPEPFRVDGATAVAFLAERFPFERPTLSPDAQAELPERLQAAGLRGGAVYDGLVALTAKAAGAELLSLDRRAAATYVRLEVEHRMLV